MSLTDLPAHPFHRAGHLDEVCALLAERATKQEATVLLAGGTDWIVEQHLAPPADAGPLPLVVDVSRLAELRDLQLDGETLRIGAAVTYLALRRNPFVHERLPLLAAMARDVGAIQIQARGTLGGNLATGSPAADGVCALAALDAAVLLRSVRGERRIPLTGYYTGYKRSVRAADEVILGFEVRVPPAGSAQHWRKVGTRQAQAISKVALAAVAEHDDGRLTWLGLGMASVAPTVAFLPSVRALGVATPLSNLTAAALEDATQHDICPIDDIRSTAAYRRHVAGALVRRFFDSLRT